MVKVARIEWDCKKGENIGEILFEADVLDLRVIADLKIIYGDKTPTSKDVENFLVERRESSREGDQHFASREAVALIAREMKNIVEAQRQFSERYDKDQSEIRNSIQKETNTFFKNRNNHTTDRRP